MLSEIPAEAQAGEGAQGIASGQQEEHARRQADAKARGRRRHAAPDEAQREPSAGEPADRGEHRRNPHVPDGLLERQPVRGHHVESGPVEPEVVAHHAERVGDHEHPQAAVAQHGGAAVLLGHLAGRRAAGGPVPQRNPGEAEHSGDDEGGAPTAAHRDPGGQHRRDDLPEADARLVHGVAQRALAGQQVLVNRLSGRRNAGGFRHTEHRAAAHQPAQPAREAGGDSGARPQSDRER